MQMHIRDRHRLRYTISAGPSRLANYFHPIEGDQKLCGTGTQLDT